MEQAEVLSLQKLVEKLDGVMAAKINVGPAGDLSEVHILAGKDRNAKQLSRDIQSAIAAATGSSVEHKIISIAQIGTEMEKQDTRLLISGLDISFAKGNFTASVTLTLQDKDYVGTCRSASSAISRSMTVAMACIDAVNQFVGDARPFVVCEAQKMRVLNRDAINVVVSYRDSYDEKILSGSAFVNEDEYQAAVKATLNAINRLIPQAAVDAV